MAKTIQTKFGEDILEIEMNEDAVNIMRNSDLDDNEKIKELYKLGVVKNLSRPSEMEEGGMMEEEQEQTESIMDLGPYDRFKKMYKRKSKPNNNFAQKNMAKGGKLKPVKENQKGLKKLPEDVRNKMGYMKMGGKLTKADKEFMYGGKMKKMMFGGKMDTSGPGMSFMKATGLGPMAPKNARRKKKMMKGGKMNYPGGGRTQLD